MHYHYILFLYINPVYTKDNWGKKCDVMLHGRKQELQLLQERYESDGSHLVALYGKRRTGKTKLLQAFCENKSHSFYVCRETTDTQQLRLFSETLLQDSVLRDYIESFQDWESLFTYLFSEHNQDKVIIIDEFPYMVQNNPQIPSILQKVLDGQPPANTLLVVTGSAMSYMEKEIFAGNKPLFGRTDEIIELGELNFSESLSLLGRDDLAAMQSVALLGGMPRYLLQFDPKVGLEENIKKRLLRKGTALYQEVDYVMKQDLREPSTYYTILEAIAHGAEKISDIAKRTDLDRTKINVYLNNLIQQRVIARQAPLTVAGRKNPNSNRYLLTNRFFNFYFRFMYPNFSALEKGQAEDVFENKVQAYLNDWLHPGFVAGAETLIQYEHKSGNLPLKLDALAAYWDKETHIDLLGSDEDGNLLAVDVVLDPQGASIDHYQSLRERLALLRQEDKERYFMIYALHGHHQSLQEMTKIDPSLILRSFKEDH